MNCNFLVMTFAGPSGTQLAEETAEEVPRFVIPSEARNLSSFVCSHLNRREIPRFARNDNVLSFSAACKACPTFPLVTFEAL
jgi:hypothetical protein